MKKKKIVKELKDLLPPVRNSTDWEKQFEGLAEGKCYEIQKKHYFPVRRFFIEKGFRLQRQWDKKKDVYRVWALAIEE